MESDVHSSKSECYIIDCKEDHNNTDRIVTPESSDSQKLENSSLVYTSNNGSSNNQKQKCEYCSATFASQQELISHLKIHTFLCTECDQTFFDANSLASHMTNHRSKKKWVCEFCYKEFSYRSFLEQHRRSHLGLKPFKCGRCGKHYSRLYNLHVHKRQHQSNGTFDCSHCSQKFSHPSNLSRHIRHDHATQTMHKCTLCPKDFSDLRSLNKHLKSHKATKAAYTGNTLSCKFCKQTFTNIDKLHQHLQTHADKDHLPSKKYPNITLQNLHLQPHNKEMKFKCEICLKSFLKLANLSHHLKSHSEAVDKKYFCRLCSNQKFTSAKLLLEHQKLRHYRKSPFVCEYCHKEFRFHSILKQHLRKHTGEKPFCCPHCKKGFVRLFNLKTHFKQHETENRVSEEETGGLVLIENYEKQKEIDWDESVNLENRSSFGNNSQKSDGVHCIPTALEAYQNINNEQIGKNKSVTFENLSLDQHNLSYDVYFLEPVDHPVSQYQEEISPISPFTSLEDMYTNGNISEKDNEHKTTLKNLSLQCDSIFFPDIENQLVVNNQQRVSPTLVKESAVISVDVPDKKAGKHNEDLNIIYENLPLELNSVRRNRLSDHQPVPINQHKKQSEELAIIPNTTSCNNDAYVDKSNEDSYVINLETDLSSKIDSREEDLSVVQPYVSDDYMIIEQISTDAVAANNSRILQYLNSQTPESNVIKEVDKTNYLLEGTTAVNGAFSESELIDLTDEINDTKTNLNFTCSYCGTIYLSLELLNDHMKLHTVTKPFVCGYCQRSFRHSHLLMQHVKNHRQQIQSFHCSKCPKSFSTYNSLTLHQQTHKKAHKEAPLNCGDCGQQFCDLQDLCHHKCISTMNMNVLTNSYDKSNNIDNIEAKKRSECLQNTTRTKNDRLHTCEHCGKVFKHQSLLTQHLRRHTGEKPFTCPICQKSFSRLFNLKVHQEQHIEKGQPPSLTFAMRPAHQINKNGYS